MRAGGRVGSERKIVWLAIAICIAAFAVIALWSQQPVAVALAALGSATGLAIIWLLPHFARQVAARWRGLAAGLRFRKEPKFEALPVPLIRFASDGTVLAMNAAARDLAGNGPKTRMAHDMFEDLGRPVADWLRDVAEGRHPGGAEVLRLRNARETRHFVQITAQRFGEAEVLGVLQDATALKRLEAQFTQSQKMQAVGQLAGGIAHDFNNILTAITGHCDLLLLRHRPDDLDHEDLQQIQQNAYRAGALVKQLLAFSRKQTLVPERIDLTEVLGELAHLLNRLLGGAVHLDLNHAPVPIALRVDKGQFEQVIVNLAVNARDAMPTGGVLRIESEVMELTVAAERDRVRVPAGSYAVIRVVDSGTGIPADIMPQIFEPFFTTKRTGEGTGLGLATVYGIVKQSGGFIFVDSAHGEGTEFQLWFPLCTTPAEAAQKVVTRRRAATEGVVLLVEDEAPVRAFAARALRLRGLTVLEAASGEQALEIAATDVKIDIFVTDVILPGLTGPEWVEQALQGRAGTPVVFISGYAADAPSEAQGRIPASVFLSKPFSLAELSETVGAQMPRPPTDQPEVLSVS